MRAEDQYIALYRAHREALCAPAPAALNAAREAACAALAEHGLPTRRDERYKYTDAAAACAPDFGVNLHRARPDAVAPFRCTVPGLQVQGCHVAGDVPTLAESTAAAQVSTFTHLAQQGDPALAEHYNRLAGKAYDGIAALNTLLAQDGLFVRFTAQSGASEAQDAPVVQVVNLAAAAADLMCNRRLIVVAEAGARGTLLLCDHAKGAARYLTTEVVEVYCAEGAQLDIYTIEEASAATTRFVNIYAHCAERSQLKLLGVNLSGGVSRTTAHVCLAGAGAGAALCGATVAGGQQRADVNLVVEHAVPGCVSDMLFKQVLEGESTGAFAGRVLVRQGAVHTASEQTSANLLASPLARAYAQPMLEIYADDVKCNHGATIGKLDESALFYMRQRGIPEDEARLLLQHAFVNEVLQRVSIEPLRERLSQLIDLRFRHGTARCRDCGLCR